MVVQPRDNYQFICTHTYHTLSDRHAQHTHNHTWHCTHARTHTHHAPYKEAAIQGVVTRDLSFYPNMFTLMQKVYDLALNCLARPYGRQLISGWKLQQICKYSCSFSFRVHPWVTSRYTPALDSSRQLSLVRVCKCTRRCFQKKLVLPYKVIPESWNLDDTRTYMHTLVIAHSRSIACSKRQLFTCQLT